MTNDEAITNLNMLSVAFVEPVTKEQRKLIDDTFEMAIKALEQQPFINKSCISEGVCREDKIKVLDKIRAEIYQLHCHPKLDFIKNDEVVDMALYIIDKYMGDKE
jgi:hypothetical protein